MNGADLFIKCLENEGVEYIFGLPGEEIRDLLSAIHKSKIKFIMTRHEQGASFMADVYGRVTGRAGVCLSTLGPGATNLLTGVADAGLDHSPVVAITGQGSLERLHKQSHQIIDIVNMFRPVTKWNTSVTSATTIPEIVRKAFKVAEMEKPGATHIEFSENIAAQMLEEKSPLPIHKLRRATPDPVALQETIEIIKKAKQPLMLAGNGAIRKRASKHLRNFVENTGIHVVSTFMGKGAISDASPFSLFTIGLGANKKIYEIMDEADVIIAVGYDIAEFDPARWNHNKEKTIVHIDFEPAEVYDYYVPQVELVADISASMWALSENIKQTFAFPEAAVFRTMLENEWKHHQDARARRAVTPRDVLYAIQQVMRENDILISDVGAHKMWVGAKFPTLHAGSVIISNGFASMGIALPGAIGAKLAKPESVIFAVTGDGGFLMNMQELETAKRMNLAFPVIIFNDYDYSLITEKFRKDHAETDPLTFGNPDFEKLAQSFDVETITVKDPSELLPALEKAVQAKTVCILDVRIDTSANRELFT